MCLSIWGCVCECEHGEAVYVCVCVDERGEVVSVCECEYVSMGRQREYVKCVYE